VTSLSWADLTIFSRPSVNIHSVPLSVRAQQSLAFSYFQLSLRYICTKICYQATKK